MLIDQLTPYLSKDNNAQVKCLQAMLDAAIVVDPVPEQGDDVLGKDLDHR
jgi:hypothetical protein